MKPAEKGKKQHRRNLLPVLLVCAALFSAGLCANAATEVTEISVSVGYFGDLYTKYEAVPLSELAANCGTGREIYTTVDRDSNPRTLEAEGIYIESILDYFGIDRDAVRNYNFYVSQQAGTYSGNSQQWTENELFRNRDSVYPCFMMAQQAYEDADRQDFLENPEEYYTIDDIYDFSAGKFRPEAWDQREVVRPMLALRARMRSWKGYTPGSTLDFSGMTDTGKPWLMFGQATSSEAGMMLFAQMVSEIRITYEGSPKITLRADVDEAEVGTEGSYSVSVETPDDFLTEKIRQGISIRTSDDSVASIDENGIISINGEGTADLIAEYKGQEYARITIKGRSGDADPTEDPSEGPTEEKEEPTKEKEDPTKANEDASGSGDGSGSSSGSGDGSSKADGDDTGAGAGKGENDSDGAGKDSSDRSGKETPGGSDSNVSKKEDKKTANAAADRSAPKSDNAAPLAQKSGSDSGAASGSGDSDIKVYKISTTDEDSYLERVISGRLLKQLGGAAGAAVALGIGIEAIHYRRQIDWIEAAKKAYKKL